MNIEFNPETTEKQKSLYDLFTAFKDRGFPLIVKESVPEGPERYPGNPHELVETLMKLGVFHQDEDFMMYVLYKLLDDAHEGYEFPIRYYGPDEPLSSDGRIQAPKEMLTDSMVESMKQS